MSVLGQRARNHPRWLQAPNDEVDDRATTPADFAELSAMFGPFDLDVAASPANAKCEEYFTRETNGLEQSWAGRAVWCNPPFSNLAPWVAKAWTEHRVADRIVMLLPGGRCEQPFWQAMVEPYRDRLSSPLSVVFLPGRMRFLHPGRSAIGKGERPPFGCCLLVWSPTFGTLRYDPAEVPADGLFAP